MPLPIDPRMLQMLQQQRGLTLNSTPVASNAAGAPYGAIPIRPGGFAGDQGQGMPMSGTMERSMINMDQAKLLRQALQALRMSTGK